MKDNIKWLKKYWWLILIIIIGLFFWWSNKPYGRPCISYVPGWEAFYGILTCPNGYACDSNFGICMAIGSFPCGEGIERCYRYDWNIVPISQNEVIKEGYNIKDGCEAMGGFWFPPPSC